MPRSYSRRRARKGGDSAQIIDLQTKVEKIEKQLSDVKYELNSLEKQDIEASMEKPKSDDDEVEEGCPPPLNSLRSRKGEIPSISLTDGFAICDLRCPV